MFQRLPLDGPIIFNILLPPFENFFGLFLLFFSLCFLRWCPINLLLLGRGSTFQFGSFDMVIVILLFDLGFLGSTLLLGLIIVIGGVDFRNKGFALWFDRRT
jgi:hypothetical protein